MKYLIVNADDFGASHGINRGIIEAHKRGIVTSTSLLVTRPRSAEAATLSRTAPELSVGLHVELRGNGGRSPADFQDRLHEELEAQFHRFMSLMGRAPTHLDSHHNVHREPDALPGFLSFAERHGLPLREHSPVCYFSKFYGQWHGESHPEQLTVASLAQLLETEIDDGITELSCHPGYANGDHGGSYRAERETELRTLCDPAIRAVLATHGIQLASYHGLNQLLEAVPK
ncbi:MAG TPA: ChbG/HpnK family deacetylase [Verrucomicrobiae bacterium]|jgi:predicted glycoside hydrolase/deacetylase ChbG (UPF0249 family)